MSLPFYGYNGEVWGTAYAAFNYLASFISQNPTSIDQIDQVAQTVYNVCQNCINAINANSLLQAWQTELVNLEQAEALPIPNVPPLVIQALVNRTVALSNAIIELEEITPDTTTINLPILVGVNVPSIPSCFILDFYETFNYETPPAGTTNANLIYAAQTQATLFWQLATIIGGWQGAFTTPAYDVAVRMAQTSQVVATMLQNWTSGPVSNDLPMLNNWNTIVALPAMVLEAYQISTAPFSLANQQQSVIKYTILLMMQQLALLLTVLRQPATSPINLVTLKVGQTLQDIASQYLGNFELWPQIAYLNNLQPPYVGPMSIPGQVCGWGQQLLLPVVGTNLAPVGNIPSYINNFLGIDIYFGPVNGDMPEWAGDFQTISGYDNLRWALGRRLQTTLGSLIYHPSYGSRIPPEIGNVQTVNTGGLINSFGISAIKGDPRVSSVISAITSLLPNFAVSFQASVQPGGYGTTPVALNEVLQPNP